jgi:hypothetical protein
MTPVFFQYGMDPIGPFDNLMATPPKENRQTFEAWRGALQRVRSWAEQHRELAKAAMVKRYDADKPEHQLKVGDEVWLYTPFPGKLTDQVHGPYVIKGFEDTHKRTATVQHKTEARDVQRAHVDRLYTRHQLPENFEPDATWLEWTRSAAEKIPKEELEAEPQHMDPRDWDEMEPDEYEIEAIVSHRTRQQKQGKKTVRKKQYLVRFKGYSPDEDKWIDEQQLKETANKLVSDYEANLDEEEKPKRQTGRRRTSKKGK